jgi:polar amino acid transport system permease protein
MPEVFIVLATWTPFLLEGLMVNLSITFGTMLLGTAVGVGLAWMRVSPYRLLVFGGARITGLFQNVPTLVLLFFTASVIPTEVVLTEELTLYFPAWLKALLALSTSPIGIVSDNVTVALKARASNHANHYFLVLPAWTNSLLITFLASSLVSLIGISEMVSRANVVISATGTVYMSAIYFYVSLIFFACAYPMTVVSKRLALRFKKH